MIEIADGVLSPVQCQGQCRQFFDGYRLLNPSRSDGQFRKVSGILRCFPGGQCRPLILGDEPTSPGMDRCQWYHMLTGVAFQHLSQRCFAS